MMQVLAVLCWALRASVRVQFAGARGTVDIRQSICLLDTH